MIALFRKSLITAAVFLFSFSRLLSQQIGFSHITSDDGLLSGNVRIILEDHQGFIWFGTEDGLQRYDGHSMVSYHHNPSDSTSLSSDYILYLFEDSKQNLWIGTLDAGLCLYDRKSDSFRRYIHNADEKNSLLGNYVRVICESSDHVLYIGLEQGGFSYFKTPSDIPSTIQFTNVAIPSRENIVGTNLVGTIIEDRDHTLLIGANGGGINRFDPKTNTFSPILLDSCSNSIHHIFLDSKNRLWIGTWDNGLYIYDREIKRMVHHTADEREGYLIQNQIETIAEDGDGNFWIGTDNGLCQIPASADPFKPNPFVLYQHEELENSSILTNSIKAFYIDSRQRIWIGSYFGGISLYDKDAVKFHPIKSKTWLPGSLMSNNVFGFEEFKPGELWVGTDGGGLYHLKTPITTQADKLKFEKIPIMLDGQSVEKIKCLEFDKTGNLWFGTWGSGLFKLNTKTKQVEHYGRNTPNGLLADEVVRIRVDSLNNLWVGTFNGGLHYFDQKRKTFSYYTKAFADGKRGINRITAIHVGKHGKVWVGREVGGLNVLNPETQQFSMIEQGELTRYLTILDIYEDDAGILWLGTHANGLIRYNPASNEAKLYNENTGMINNVVYAIVPDKPGGTLWLSTNQGLLVFNVAQETFTNFNKADGLQGNQFNPGSGFIHSSGLMLFGGIDGMNIFNASEIKKKDLLSPVVFTRFWLDNVEVNVNDRGSPLKENIILAPTIELAYNQNSFSLEFAMLEYNMARRNQYSYILENLNDNWQNIGTERKATFTNLYPGTYTLKVKATNTDGLWTPDEKTIAIVIHPAWWQTVFFKVSLILGAVLFTFIGVRIRVHYLLTQKQKLEGQVAERTLELKDKNVELANKIDEIQSQNKKLHAQKIEIAEMNQEIQAQNEELTSQNDQISLQRENLEVAGQKLREINDQLEEIVQQRTSKLEETITELDKTVAELDRFVYSASHDLSAPLKSVLGLVRIAKFEKNPDEVQKYYNYIETSIQKLDRVIKSLVEFSRNSHQEVKFECVYLHKLTEEVLLELAYWPEAQKVKLLNNIPPDVCLNSDPDRLKVVFHNLIGNGIKYADVSKANSFIQIDVIKTESSLTLKIADNGIGIDQEKHGKIFDMYYRATDRSKGSGLGLFIVKEILLKIGGRIELTSSLGVGTTFILSFNTDEYTLPA